jgi:hypothetical protein
LKERFLWISVVIIAISWVMNYAFYQSKQLDQPIFLQHYLETQIYEDNQFTFYYLTNKRDISHVTYVEIDGKQFFPHHYSPMWSDNNIPHYEQEFRHHYLRSIMIQFPKNLMPIDAGAQKEWSFKEMEVGFSDRPSIKVNIGKVIFSPATSEEKLLESRVSSSSNQHRSDTAFAALNPVTIEDISVPFPEIEKDIEMKVNLDQEKLTALKGMGEGKDSPDWFHKNMEVEWKNVKGTSVSKEIFPFTLEKNDWLQITTFANPNRKSVFDFSIKIKGTTSDGNAFTSQAHINDRPYLGQKEVDEIIKEAKGGSTQ